MPSTLRGCIVSEPGYTFISLDAIQIELKVLALLSQDPKLLEDTRTKDIHMATAIRMFGIPTQEEALTHLEDQEITNNIIDQWIKDVMKSRRYKAKQGNFALVYEANEDKLSEMLECTVEEAREFMAEHRATYPVLYKWIDATKAKAKEDGYVVNIFGRIRPLPELSGGSWRIREAAEREIINTLCQGTAVDIVKMAMLYLRGILDPVVRLILQVHDEILFEVPDELVEDTLDKVKELALAFPDYPFKAAVGVCYGELKEIE